MLLFAVIVSWTYLLGISTDAFSSGGKVWFVGWWLVGTKISEKLNLSWRRHRSDTTSTVWQNDDILSDVIDDSNFAYKSVCFLKLNHKMANQIGYVTKRLITSFNINVGRKTLRFRRVTLAYLKIGKLLLTPSNFIISAVICNKFNSSGQVRLK